MLIASFAFDKDFVGMRGGDLGSTQSIRQKVIKTFVLIYISMYKMITKCNFE